MSSAHAVESAIMLSLVKRLTTHRSFLAAAALGILLPSCRSRNGLVGEWVSVTRGRGGVAATVDFRPDASFTSAYETMLDCFYRLEKAQLILSCPDPKTGQNSNELVETRLEGDTLVLKAPWDGTEYQMTRAGKAAAGAPPIVGKWVSGATGPRPAVVELTGDGKLTFRQQLRTGRGKYVVAGDALTLNFEGGPSQKGTFRIDGDSLILTPEKGERQTFKRAQETNERR